MQETPKEVNLLWPLLVKWDEKSERLIYWAELSTASVFTQNMVPLTPTEGLAILSKLGPIQPSQPLPDFISIADSRIKTISEKAQDGKFKVEHFDNKSSSGGSPSGEKTPNSDSSD